MYPKLYYAFLTGLPQLTIYTNFLQFKDSIYFKELPNWGCDTKENTIYEKSIRKCVVANQSGILLSTNLSELVDII